MTRRKHARPWSLLKRLVAWYGCSVILLILAGNIVQYWLLDGMAEADRNAILSDRMSAVSSLLKAPGHGHEELFDRVLHEWPTRGGEKTFLRLLDGRHQEIVRTPGFPEELLQASNEALSRPPYLSEPLRLRSAGGQIVIARAETMVSAGDFTNPVYVFGAISGDEFHAFSERFKKITALVVLASLLISLALGWQIAKRGLSPMRHMTEAVSGIHSKTLHERLSLDDLPTELHRLAQAFNETLDKLEESFGRLSRFSSDIAHELRTPLSNMLGAIEVALSRPRTREEYEEILGSSLEECARLKQTIESLLFLARAENLESAFHVEKVDAAAELRGLVEFYEPSAANAKLELKYVAADGDGPMVVGGEQTLFQRAIGNLLSNAVRYAAPGGHVRVSCRQDGAHVRIVVEDSGPGIAPEHLKRIFDRFYRVDSARSSSSGSGVGLGLSIAKSIVELHKGRIEVVSGAEGTKVSVEWPVWQAPGEV